MQESKPNGIIKVRLSGKGFTRALFFPKETEEQLLVLFSILLSQMREISETQYSKGVTNGLPHVTLCVDDSSALNKRTLWEINKILNGVFQRKVSINII